MDKFHVFGERVLILPDSAENVSKGGIIFPESAKSKTYWGTVINMGDYVTCELHEGDHVFYDKYAGTPIVIDDKEYVIVKYEEILGGSVNNQND